MHFFSKNSEILLSLLETLFCVYPNVFEHRESFRTTGRHTLLSQCKMLMCQLSVYLYAEGAPVPSLLHIWREPTDTKYWSQCFWCVNCQHICQQKMHLWTVPSLLHIWREYVCRKTCQLVPMLLMCQLSAYLSAKDAPLDCSQLHIWREYVCIKTCQLVPKLLLCQLSAYL